MSKTTAIIRKRPSLPARWLSSRNLLKGKCLDFGGGRGFDALHYNMDHWDPHWSGPDYPTKLYDTITCTYVLNVVEPYIKMHILNDVHALLTEGGTAYFTVRRDIPRSGKPGRNCFQHYIILDQPYFCIREISSYAIYKLRKNIGKTK